MHRSILFCILFLPPNYALFQTQHGLLPKITIFPLSVRPDSTKPVSIGYEHQIYPINPLPPLEKLVLFLISSANRFF